MIPNEGETGTIEDSDTLKVLGLGLDTDEFAPVFLESFDGAEDQMWTRSKRTSTNGFTLKNKASGMFLFVYYSPTRDVKIRGIISSWCLGVQ